MIWITCERSDRLPARRALQLGAHGVRHACRNSRAHPPRCVTSGPAGPWPSHGAFWRPSPVECQQPSTEELVRRGSSAGSPDPTRQNFEIVAADDPVTLSIGNGKSTRIENVQHVGGFFCSPAFDAATIERLLL